MKLLLLTASLLLCTAIVNAVDPYSLNREAIDLAGRGELTRAKYLFEEALRLDGSNSQFYNNLGVTYLRLQQYAEAEKNFKKALEIDPRNGDAVANLRELGRYYPVSASPKHDTSVKQAESQRNKGNDAYDPLRYTRKQKKIPDPVPRIHIKDLQKPENIQYLDGKLPYILTGAMESWGINSLWTVKNLTKMFGDSTVDFYPNNMDTLDRKPFLISMSEALQELLHPSGKYPTNSHIPGTYIQWNVNETDWQKLERGMVFLPYYFQRDKEWLEECLPTMDLRQEFTKKVHWRMMLIATKGAGMFNHIDVLRTASWQAQVAGSKKWHLCSPDQSPYLYGAGGVDCFYPNYEKAPLFEHAKCFQGIVHAGEMVYYPKDFWHQTENQETPSISVSGCVIDQNNYEECYGELDAACRLQKYQWNLSKDLCKHLEGCVQFWRARYDPRRDRGQCESDENEGTSESDGDDDEDDDGDNDESPLLTQRDL